MRSVEEINGDLHIAVQHLNNLGSLLTNKGEFDAALAKLHEALQISTELEDSPGIARALGNIGTVYVSSFNFPEALAYYHRALDLLETLGDRNSVSIVLGNIANVYTNCGEYPKALEYHQKSLEIAVSIQDLRAQAFSLGNIGVDYHGAGDATQALKYYEQALHLHEEQGDRSEVGRVLNNIGIEYEVLGDDEKALSYYRQAIATFDEIGFDVGLASVLGDAGTLLLRLGRVDEASEYISRQESLPRSILTADLTAEINRSILRELDNDMDGAHTLLTQALERTRATGLRLWETTILKRLRDLAQKRNDFASYITYNDDLARVTEEIRGTETARRLTLYEAERRITEERRAREREREVLYSTLPKHVADRVIKGENVNDNFEQAAVMFIDVVNFTSHSADMLPNDVVTLLERLFARFDMICEKHNVTKVKTIGDSYMCFKGDAGGLENVLAVAKAALEMRRTSVMWSNGEPLALRIGAHLGPVTAGVIGTQRLQYDVWGDTVNVASRMESTSEPGRIQVSEAFAHVLRPPSSVLRSRGEVEIKGKGMMKSFWLEEYEER